MAYTTVSELTELLPNEIIGNEDILVTDSLGISKKMKLSTFSDYNISEISNAVDLKISESIVPISIMDEGVDVGVVSKINFIGAIVNSFVNTNGVIDVYIPGATYSSNFNLVNNSTDARVNTTTTYDRYISSPLTSEFSLGNFIPGVIHKCTNANSFSYSTAEKFYVEQDAKIRIEVHQDTLIDELEYFIENGTYNSTLGLITSTIINKQIELSHFTAEFSCSLNLIDLSGYTKIIVKYIGSTTNEFIEEFFIDNSPDLSDISITPNITNVIYKYLSGIKYIGSGSIENNITLINSKSFTYPNNLVDLDGVLAGFGTYNYSVSDLNITDFTYNTNINITKTYNILPNKIYQDLSIRGRVNDWTSGVYKEFLVPALINTSTDSSTRVYENFVSETNRLKNDLTVLTAFNSQDVLGPFDLQVHNSKLVYPTLNFSGYYSNPDYSTLVNDRNYVRKFWHTNTSHSNGILYLVSNITELDLSQSNVKIEISLNAVDWYDCSLDYLGGALVNGSGCRINSDTNNVSSGKIEFTLGLDKFTDISSDWGIYLKISIKETSKDKYIDSIQIINWN